MSIEVPPVEYEVRWTFDPIRTERGELTVEIGDYCATTSRELVDHVGLFCAVLTMAGHVVNRIEWWRTQPRFKWR